MSQYNLFTGEMEQEYTPVFEPEPEPVPDPPKKSTRKRKQAFVVNRCKKCDQLILRDPNNDRDNGLCEMCDTRLTAQFNKYQEFRIN